MVNYWGNHQTQFDNCCRQLERLQQELQANARMNFNTYDGCLNESIFTTANKSSGASNPYAKLLNNYTAALDEIYKEETARQAYNQKQVTTQQNNSPKQYSSKTTGSYNPQAGKRLVDTANQMLQKYGSSTGYCATGVSRTISMAYGISMGGNGCDWDTNMDKLVAQGLFTEVTGDYATSADLANLPAGAVVCWENTGGKNGGGAQYGHVTIADGNGGEISDHHAKNIYKTIGGRSDQYRVFLPIA